VILWDMSPEKSASRKLAFPEFHIPIIPFIRTYLIRKEEFADGSTVQPSD
jgi:hypothetical protein